MPLNLQVRLLRVLEEKQIYRVGGERAVPVNIRLVGATRADLEEAVNDGLFREDLYYRLNVLRIHLPNLNERTEDISLLAWHFLKRAFKETQRPTPHPYFSPETLRLLEEQPWKGNVRELRNIMTRIAVLLPKRIGIILPAHILPYLPEVISPKNQEEASENSFSKKPEEPNQITYHQEKIEEKESQESKEAGIFIPIGTTIEDASNQLIEETLQHTDYNRTKAAKILGIGLRTLRRKLNTPG
jgi:DNA-binding NtrC family response regulator